MAKLIVKHKAIAAAKEALDLKKQIAVLTKRQKEQTKIFGDYCRKKGLFDTDDLKISERLTKNIVAVAGGNKKATDKGRDMLLSKLDKKFVKTVTSVTLVKADFIDAVENDDDLKALLAECGLEISSNTTYSVKSIV